MDRENGALHSVLRYCQAYKVFLYKKILHITFKKNLIIQPTKPFLRHIKYPVYGIYNKLQKLDIEAI